MSIIRQTKTLIFNNAFCKPMTISDMGVDHWSMVVLYKVNNLVHYGQFNFDTKYWSVLDGSNSKLQFSDDMVIEWWYTPDSIKILKEEEIKRNNNRPHAVKLNNVV